ncbi:MAG: hypothetical protein OIF54_13970 [Cohaesibacter sp.]|nr:hypothetical protein [Cohaesibacter sp.]
MFTDSGNTIAFTGDAANGMDHTTDDWHFYEVEVTVSRETLDFLGQAHNVAISSDDVQRAVAQHSAPEWADVIGLDASSGIPMPTNGSTTNTFGPGDVFHVVGSGGLAVGNVTQGWHPFSHGAVAKSTYVAPNGDVVVQTVGVGNSWLGDNFLGYAAGAINSWAGGVLFSDPSSMIVQAVVNAREGSSENSDDVSSQPPETPNNPSPP